MRTNPKEMDRIIKLIILICLCVFGCVYRSNGQTEIFRIRNNSKKLELYPTAITHLNSHLKIISCDNIDNLIFSQDTLVIEIGYDDITALGDSTRDVYAIERRLHYIKPYSTIYIITPQATSFNYIVLRSIVDEYGFKMVKKGKYRYLYYKERNVNIKKHIEQDKIKYAFQRIS